MISLIIGGLFCIVFSILTTVTAGISILQIFKKKWKNAVMASYIAVAFLYGSITGYEFATGHQRTSEYEDVPRIR